MKKKPVCVFKGKDKEKFDTASNKFQSYKRTIEDLSYKTYEVEKFLWEMIKNTSSKFKNVTLTDSVFSFRYNCETGEVYEIEK